MTPRETWLLSAAAALGAVLIFVRSRSSEDKDIDALARMLIAETSFQHSKEEMAQIVFVAVNRARRNNVSLSQVVTPPGKPTWNTAALYRSRWENAPRNSLWLEAVAFVKQVLDGAYRNLGATSFVHPGGMPVPPCADNRVAAATLAGQRCMPSWAVTGKTVGKGVFV